MSNNDAGRDSPESEIAHRSITTDPDDADYEFLELIAEQESCDVTDLPPMHPRIDDVVSEVFQDPPSKDAQLRIQFSYFGYRVDLDQSGNVSLMRVTMDADDH